MSRTWRAGTAKLTARALLPLVHDTVSGGINRLLGRAPMPWRDSTRPDAATSPSFGSASWVAGMTPGTLVRARRMRSVGTRGPLNPAESLRFEYVTTDSSGRLITATGAYFQPHRRNGTVIAFVPSTQGVARHCDPSLSCTLGLNAWWTQPRDLVVAYEQPAINYLLASGSAVILIDYPRDPTLGWQLYCDHPSGARALADAVRACRQLGVDDSSLGLWGFSQGGGAVAKMLEEPEYAPDVTPAAAVVGAPPADLHAVLKHVDGSMVTGVIAYTVAGLMVTSPEIRDEVLGQLNGHGIDELITNATTCTGGSVLSSGWTSTSTWSHDGRTLGEIATDLPSTIAEIHRRQLGAAAPRVPVRLWGSRNDDIIPFSAVEETLRSWRRLGAGDLVDWQERRLPRIPGRTGLNHFAPYFQGLRGDVGWLLEQVRG